MAADCWTSRHEYEHGAAVFVGAGVAHSTAITWSISTDEEHNSEHGDYMRLSGQRSTQTRQRIERMRRIHSAMLSFHPPFACVSRAFIHSLLQRKTVKRAVTVYVNFASSVIRCGSCVCSIILWIASHGYREHHEYSFLQ